MLHKPVQSNVGVNYQAYIPFEQRCLIFPPLVTMEHCFGEYLQGNCTQQWTKHEHDGNVLELLAAPVREQSAV